LPEADDSSSAKRHVYSENCENQSEEAREVSEFILCEQQRQYEDRGYNENP
jgi:hypothetical protein